MNNKQPPDVTKLNELDRVHAWADAAGNVDWLGLVLYGLA